MSVLRGRAWVFGDQISTDQILPGRYLDRSYAEVGQFAMAGADEEFAKKVQPGDIVVAGANFGCGSSREAAAVALRQAGVGAVVAPSFSRIFYRNAVNQGLPAVAVPDVEGFLAGDIIEVDLENRRVRNVSRPEVEKPILNLQGVSRQILAAGGIVPFVKARTGAASGA